MDSKKEEKNDEVEKHKSSSAVGGVGKVEEFTKNSKHRTFMVSRKTESCLTFHGYFDELIFRDILVWQYITKI